jgi:hypothetical protein
MSSAARKLEHDVPAPSDPASLHQVAAQYERDLQSIAAMGLTPEEFAKLMDEPGLSLDQAIAAGWIDDPRAAEASPCASST